MLITGGADGADKLWAELGIKFGHEVTIVSFKGHHRVNVTGARVVELSSEELKSYDGAVTATALVLGRHPGSGYTRNLLRRNMAIVDCDVLFAVGMRGVGGTAWGVAAAIRSGIPVRFFDQTTLKWHDETWREIAAPKISEFATKRIGAIGSRDLTEAGASAMVDVFSR